MVAAEMADIWVVACAAGAGGDSQLAIARTTRPGAPGRRRPIVDRIREKGRKATAISSTPTIRPISR